MKQLSLTLLAMSLLSATAMAADDKPAMHGSVSFGFESEQWRCKSGQCTSKDNGGKIKWNQLNVNLRPDNGTGLSFGGYMGREFGYQGDLFDHTENDKDNQIMEAWISKDLGNGIWTSLTVANESDNRLDIGPKIGGSKKINDTMDVHGYAFYKRRSRAATDGGYLEVEPGLGWNWGDKGAWLNLRYQRWDWDANLPTDADWEREMIIKPGFWFNFPEQKIGMSVWSEIGKFEKDTANHYTEDYKKFGVSGNYQINKSWKISGEANIKFRKDSADDFNAKRQYPFFATNVSYEF